MWSFEGNQSAGENQSDGKERCFPQAFLALLCIHVDFRFNNNWVNQMSSYEPLRKLFSLGRHSVWEKNSFSSDLFLNKQSSVCCDLFIYFSKLHLNGIPLSPNGDWVMEKA